MFTDGKLDTSWSERAALAAVWAVSGASLAGYAVFTLFPQLLTRSPRTAAVYGQMFVVAPRAQIIVAFGALAAILVRRVGTRWLVAFAAVYGVSLLSELAGTTVGLPFGPYSYTDTLGLKLFGHVPFLIPASWFFMALPSYALAGLAGPDRVVRRVLLASFILVSWDLALDPAMSLVTRYWQWGTDGPYYGMPLLNLFGWYVTGLALMAVFAALRSGEWLTAVPARWLTSFYAANLLLPVGMLAVAGHWGAIVATLGALAAAAWLRHEGVRRVPSRAAVVS